MSAAFFLVALKLFAAGDALQRTAAAPPGPLAQQTAVEIRREATMPPRGPQGRPLPLASHWNMGSHGSGWTPHYQIELLHQGRHILPWFPWPDLNPDKDAKTGERFRDYYDDLMSYCRELRLPISFRGTQWEKILLDQPYRDLPAAENPGTISPAGKVVRKLCPFGPIEPWQEPAKAYVDTPGMKRLQQLYPNPPLVLFVSNNEAPDLRWHQVEELSQRYLDRYGKGRPDQFKREVVARGWMERYPTMFRSMRKALVNDTWRNTVRFVGYGAFGPSHFGRWEGWKEYSLITDEWTAPDWHIWDGGSPSYYTHNWNDTRDHWVFSTQVESMNWLFQLEEAWRVNPEFWWEISTWDGNSSDWTPQSACTPDTAKKSKACQYALDGQTYTPDRCAGWLQFGMWLVRPRAVREFRGSTTPLEPWRVYFEQLLDAVDRVYSNSTLMQFWRFGTLVPNPAQVHPYQVDVPAKYRDIDRWFLLDTSLDPPRPWEAKTDLPVFSLALVQGQPGARRWLIYAHSPLANRSGVQVTVPDFGAVVVDVPRAGAFYLVSERDRKVSVVLR